MYSRKISRQRNRTAAAAFIFLMTGNICSSEPRMELDAEEAMNWAEEHSKELEIAELDLLARRSLYDFGLREYLPRLNVSFSGNDSVLTEAADSRVKRIALTVSQPIYNGGRTRLARKLAGYELVLAGQSLEEGKTELADSVWSLYHRILVAEEKKSIQEETFCLLTEQFDVTAAERELGLITELEYLQTEIEVKDMEIAVKETELSLDDLYYEFKQALSLPADSVLRLTGRIDASYGGTEIGAPAEFYIDLAKQNNLALRTAEYGVRKAEEELRYAKRGYVPAIDLEASFLAEGARFPLQVPGFSLNISVSFPSPVFPLELQGNVGIKGNNRLDRGYSVSAPLADNISFPADRNLQALSLRAGQIEAETTLERMAFTIRKTLNGQARARERLSLGKASLAVYGKKLRVLEEQLDMGELRRIEYVDARLEYLERELALLEMVLSLIETERSIEKISGIGPGELAAYDRIGREDR